jgi:hypothetical protein
MDKLQTIDYIWVVSFWIGDSMDEQLSWSYDNYNYIGVHYCQSTTF